MGQITSSGCARNNQILGDKVNCSLAIAGAPMRLDHELSDQVTTVMMYLLFYLKIIINNKGSFNDKFNNV